MDVNQFKEIAGKYKAYKKEIYEINQQIEMLEYLLCGVAGIRYDKEVTQGSGNTETDAKRISIISKIDQLKADKHKYQSLINQITEIILATNNEVKIYLVEYYLQDKGMSEIARESNKTYWYVRRTIEKELKRVLEGKNGNQSERAGSNRNE